MRTALRVGAIGLLILVVAAVAALVIQRDQILARVSASLTHTLSAQLGGTVTVTNVRLHFIPLTVVVEGLTVHSASPDIPVIPLAVDRIVARPSLISLLTETPVIRWLRVEHPRVELVTGPGNTMNMPRPKAAEPSQGTPRPAALIKRVDILDAEISYRSPTAGVALSQADAVLSPDLVTGHIDADLDAPKGLVSVGDRKIPLGATRLRVALDRGRLTMKDFSVTAAGLSASGRGTIAFEGPPEVDVAATVSIDLDPLLRAFFPAHRATGRVETQARITGPLAAPEASGPVTARGLSYDGIAIGDASAHVQERGGRLVFTDATGNVFGGSVKGHGTLDLSVVPAAWSAMLETSELHPAPLLRYLNPRLAMLPAYTVSGPVDAKGRGSALGAMDADARLALGGVPRVAPAAESPAMARVRALLNLIASADVPAALHGGRLTLTGASVATASGRVTVTGAITTTGDADLTLDADGQDIAAIAAALALPFPTAGVGAFRGRLTGPLASPVVEGRASIRDLVLRGHPAGNLAATLRYAERRLTIHDTDWRKGDARYDTVGTLDWTGPSSPAFDLIATLRRARVHEVLPIVFRELPIVAAADGTFTFKGAPADFVMAGDLTVGSGSIWGQTFDNGVVRMTIDRQRVTFVRAALRRGESEVRGRGSISYHDGFEARFDAPKVYLQSLNIFELNRLPISGTASASLDMRGTFDRPEMHGAATIAYLEGAGQALGAGTATLDVADHRLALAVSLDDQHARLSTTLRWEPSFPWSGDLTLENSSLIPLLRPWLPPALASLNTSLTGRVTFEGPLRDPVHWKVRARISQLSADVGEYVVENQDEIALGLDGGRLTVESCRLRGTDTTLTVSGGADLFKEYRLLIVGEADLRLTRLFVPTITAGRGKTYMVLKISDRWDAPKIQGGVTIQDARIKSRALAQPITITSVGLFFNERQILLESLEGSVGNGRVSASGRIDLAGFRPGRFGVLIDIAGVQFPLTETLVPTFSGQLVLAGTQDAQSLRGELTVDRALYNTRIDIQDWLLDLRKRTEAQQVAEGPALTRGLSLNIHFVGRDEIAVKNNVADVALEVDVFLRGTVDHPYLIGRIEARDGRLTFRNNTFEIQSTTVDFTDPTRFRPEIDLHATTKVQEYDITLHLNGNIERFDLDLASDPSLSETDILALLTVGRTAEQVSQSQSTIGRDEALSIAMQRFLEEGIQKLPGVDRLVDSFQIDPRYDPTLGTSAPQISVGKQLLDDRLVLRYSTLLDQSGRQGIRVEYQLGRNVFLIGEQDSTRGFGGDIRFRFDFR